MRKHLFSRLLLITLVFLLALFFFVFGFFHVEKDLKTDNACPICRFEKSSTLSLCLNPFILVFSALHIIFFEILTKDRKIKLSYFFHTLGQRAPPLSIS